VQRRMIRRIAGNFSRRLMEAELEKVEDERDRRGRRWPLATVLRTVVLSMLAGAKSLADMESLTANMTVAMKRRFGLQRRLPDTTARSVLCGLNPEPLVLRLHAVVRKAARRKAIKHDGLPFGVVSLDGKGTAIPAVDDWYAQRQSQQGGKLTGLVRTVTAVLTSSPARPLIDVTPLPARTHEVGWFQAAFEHLMAAYGSSDGFRLVTYDAGATSLHNADTVRRHGVHYLFGLKDTQPSLRREAERLLGSRPDSECDASSTDADGGVRRVYLTTVDPGLCGWDHLRTFVRVTHTSKDKQGKVEQTTRYFLSSLPQSRLRPKQWLLVIRRHWAVETTHQILDMAFKEDDKPWITSQPRGAAVLMMLRRIAYTLLTFFLNVTLRSDEHRAQPWKTLMRSIDIALLTATAEDLAGLREHPAPS